MAKAAAAFHHFDENTGELLTFREGDDLPDSVARQVEDHVLSGRRPAPLIEKIADDADADELRRVNVALTEEVERLGHLVGERDLRIAELEAALADGKPDADGADVPDVSGDVQDASGDDVPDIDAEHESTSFDPAKHSVDEVLDYLETADEEESNRVRDMERAGKSRKGILGDDD